MQGRLNNKQKKNILLPLHKTIPVVWHTQDVPWQINYDLLMTEIMRWITMNDYFENKNKQTSKQ